MEWGVEGIFLHSPVFGPRFGLKFGFWQGDGRYRPRDRIQQAAARDKRKKDEALTAGGRGGTGGEQGGRD